MKVIFLEDIPSVAKAGEVKEVAPGYARNYLFPKSLALVATPSAIKSNEALREKLIRQKARTEAEFKELAAKLENAGVVIRTKVGAKNHLYGSITKADIALRIQEDLGITIDKRKIEIEKTIKTVGVFEITIKLSQDIKSKLKVSVEEKKSENERRETTSS